MAIFLGNRGNNNLQLALIKVADIPRKGVKLSVSKRETGSRLPTRSPQMKWCNNKLASVFHQSINSFPFHVDSLRLHLARADTERGYGTAFEIAECTVISIKKQYKGTWPGTVGQSSLATSTTSCHAWRM